MDVNERIELRTSLLDELYENHFTSNGLGITYENDILRADFEKNLAYQYLEEKRLVERRSPGGTNTEFILTACGIDEVESNRQKQKV